MVIYANKCNKRHFVHICKICYVKGHNISKGLICCSTSSIYPKCISHVELIIKIYVIHKITILFLHSTKAAFQSIGMSFLSNCMPFLLNIIPNISFNKWQIFIPIHSLDKRLKCHVNAHIFICNILINPYYT